MINELQVANPNITPKKVQDYFTYNIYYNNEKFGKYLEICEPYCEKYDNISHWVGYSDFEELSKPDLIKIYNEMKNLNNNINETQHIIYRVEILTKISTEVNKVFVYNSIRGIYGVVVVNVVQNDYLDSQSTDQYEYTLLQMKYMVTSNAKDDLEKIKKTALISDKIEGLIQFIPRYQTIEKVGEY